MQDERFEDDPKDLDWTVDGAPNTAARIDDPDLAWSESEGEEIGDDFDSEGERELATQDGGADDEDWELTERGAVFGTRACSALSATDVGTATQTSLNSIIDSDSIMQ